MVLEFLVGKKLIVTEIFKVLDTDLVFVFKIVFCFVCGSFYGTPVQYWSYSAVETLESVKRGEQESYCNGSR